MHLTDSQPSGYLLLAQIIDEATVNDHLLSFVEMSDQT